MLLSKFLLLLLPPPSLNSSVFSGGQAVEQKGFRNGQQGMGTGLCRESYVRGWEKVMSGNSEKWERVQESKDGWRGDKREGSAPLKCFKRDR
jgi:hypothetical protein